MAKTKVNVSLFDDNGTLHQFSAGDDLPSWASDQVGDHVIDGVDEGPRIDTDIDHATDTSAVGVETAAVATPAVDFTKPAAQKRTAGK